MVYTFKQDKNEAARFGQFQMKASDVEAHFSKPSHLTFDEFACSLALWYRFTDVGYIQTSQLKMRTSQI